MKNISGYVALLGLALLIYGGASIGLRGEGKPISKTSKSISILSIIIGIILIFLWGRQPSN